MPADNSCPGVPSARRRRARLLAGLRRRRPQGPDPAPHHDGPHVPRRHQEADVQGARAPPETGRGAPRRHPRLCRRRRVRRLVRRHPSGRVSETMSDYFRVLVVGGTGAISALLRHRSRGPRDPRHCAEPWPLLDGTQPAGVSRVAHHGHHRSTER